MVTFAPLPSAPPAEDPSWNGGIYPPTLRMLESPPPPYDEINSPSNKLLQMMVEKWKKVDAKAPTEMRGREKHQSKLRYLAQLVARLLSLQEHRNSRTNQIMEFYEIRSGDSICNTIDRIVVSARGATVKRWLFALKVYHIVNCKRYLECPKKGVSRPVLSGEERIVVDFAVKFGDVSGIKEKRKYVSDFAKKILSDRPNLVFAARFAVENL